LKSINKKRTKFHIMPNYLVKMPCGEEIVGSWRVLNKNKTIEAPVFRSRKGKNKRLDIWFRLGEKIWWGTKYGDSDVCYCIETKRSLTWEKKKGV